MYLEFMLLDEEIELWQFVPGYEGIYMASTMGRIKSIDRFRNTKGGTASKCPVVGIMKGTVIGDSGYEMVLLSNNSVNKNLLVHRIIAATFIPNPENKPQVNHKWGNKLDNRAIALEWATRSENMQHAHRFGLVKKGDHSKREKSILMLSIDNEPLKIFKSVNEAKRRTGISNGAISGCALGNNPLAGGYRWRFYSEEMIKRYKF